MKTSTHKQKNFKPFGQLYNRFSQDLTKPVKTAFLIDTEIAELW